VHGDQGQPEVADLVQQPVQGGLVGYLAGDDRLAAVVVDLEPLEPGRPAPVQDSIDPDLIARCARPGAHLRTLEAGWLVAPVPFGRTSSLITVICTFLARRLRALHATKPEGAWRHPKVPIRWNLPRRRWAPTVGPGPAGAPAMAVCRRGCWEREDVVENEETTVR